MEEKNKEEKASQATLGTGGSCIVTTPPRAPQAQWGFRTPVGPSSIRSAPSPGERSNIPRNHLPSSLGHRARPSSGSAESPWWGIPLGVRVGESKGPQETDIQAGSLLCINQPA